MTFTQAGADVWPRPAEGAPSVPMLADTVDAVIGVDTHRDARHAEIAHPSAAVIAACSVPNTSGGYAQRLAWAREMTALRLDVSRLPVLAVREEADHPRPLAPHDGPDRPG